MCRENWSPEFEPGHRSSMMINNNNDDDDKEEEEQQQGDAEGQDEEQQHRLQIAEEHAVWKKNSPLLYDWVSTYALEWPSLTVQWLPDVVKSARRDDFNTHRLLIGTNTSDQEPNYLMIAEVDLPSLDVEIDVRSRPDGSDVLSSRFDKGLDIKTRILHDGEVNRARYMPQNTVRLSFRRHEFLLSPLPSYSQSLLF